MGFLEEQSELYRELSNLYDNRNGDITLELYKSAVNIVEQHEKNEAMFILFNLRYCNEDVKSGIDTVDKLLNKGTHIINSLTGKDLKLAFIFSVIDAVY